MATSYRFKSGHRHQKEKSLLSGFFFLFFSLLSFRSSLFSKKCDFSSEEIRENREKLFFIYFHITQSYHFCGNSIFFVFVLVGLEPVSAKPNRDDKLRKTFTLFHGTGKPVPYEKSDKTTHP